MSLGIKLSWRVRRSIHGSAPSLIPRGPWTSPRNAAAAAVAAAAAARPLPPPCARAPSLLSSFSSVPRASPLEELADTTAASPKPLPGRQRLGETSDTNPAVAVSKRSTPSLAAYRRPVATDMSAESRRRKELRLSLQDKADTAISKSTGKQATAVAAAGESAATRPCDQQAAMAPPVVRYPNPRETHLSQHRHVRAANQQLRLELKRQALGLPVPDWRKVLDVLRNKTLPATWKTGSRTILVTDQVANMLLHEPDKTIWDINRRLDCRLTLSRPEAGGSAGGGSGGAAASTSTWSSLVLTGNDLAIELAKAEVSHMATESSASAPLPEAEDTTDVSPAVPSKTVGGGSPVGRSWSSARRLQRPSHQDQYDLVHRYEDIPVPEERTKRSFEAYVAAIKQGKMAPHVAARLYGSGPDADQAAVALMTQLFLAESSRPLVTRRALVLALYFMVERGPAFRPHAKSLLRHMERRGLPLDTEIFNILLQWDVMDRDLAAFDRTLRNMVKRGHLPNLKTWKLFLDVIENDQVRQHALRAMNDCGLLQDVRGRQTVAGVLVHRDLAEERSRWQGVAAFLARQDHKYGPSWMNRSTMQQIMNELGRLGKLASCRDFLEVAMQAKNARPTTATLNIMLHHARTHRSPQAATSALSRFAEAGLAPDATSYHELFTLFFTLRKPNAMAIVWRMACLEGKTTWAMRKRVSKIYNAYPHLAVDHGFSLGGAPSSSPSVPSSSSDPAAPSAPAAAMAAAKALAAVAGDPHHPKNQYASTHAGLPTFHHPDMLPELLQPAAAASAVETQAASAAGDETDPAVALSPRSLLLPSVGSVIAQLYRQRWPCDTWRSTVPLDLMLMDAWEADLALDARARRRRGVGRHPVRPALESSSKGEEERKDKNEDNQDSDNDIRKGKSLAETGADDMARVAEPGVPMFLHKIRRNLGPASGGRFDPSSGSNSDPDTTAARQRTTPVEEATENDKEVYTDATAVAAAAVAGATTHATGPSSPAVHATAISAKEQAEELVSLQPTILMRTFGAVLEEVGAEGDEERRIDETESHHDDTEGAFVSEQPSGEDDRRGRATG